MRPDPRTAVYTSILNLVYNFSQLVVYADPWMMFMMMSKMNRQNSAASRAQVNNYHIGGNGGFGYPGMSGGFPGTSFGGYGDFQEQDFSMRTPAANSMPRLMPSFGGTDYTQTIPRVHRGDGMQGSFSF